jgi:hypothetical protein
MARGFWRVGAAERIRNAAHPISMNIQDRRVLAPAARVNGVGRTAPLARVARKGRASQNTA